MNSARQHAGLTLERWVRFSLDQQILMIANEMHRGSKFFEDEDRDRLQDCYVRSFALTDLTVAAHQRKALRRELLRWREVVGALYSAERADPAGHRLALRCLLQFTPVSARQVPIIAPF